MKGLSVAVLVVLCVVLRGATAQTMPAQYATPSSCSLTCVPKTWTPTDGSVDPKPAPTGCKAGVAGNTTADGPGLSAPMTGVAGLTPPRWNRVVVKSKAFLDPTSFIGLQVAITPSDKAAAATKASSVKCNINLPRLPPPPARKLLGPQNDDNKNNQDTAGSTSSLPPCFFARVSANCTETGTLYVDYAIAIDGSFALEINGTTPGVSRPIKGSPFAVSVGVGASSAIAYYAENGQKILVKFDGPTNKPEIKKCSDVFVSPEGVIGANAKCEFDGESTISIQPKGARSGKTLTFKAGNGIKVAAFVSSEAAGTLTIAGSEASATGGGSGSGNGNGNGNNGNGNGNSGSNGNGNGNNGNGVGNGGGSGAGSQAAVVTSNPNLTPAQQQKEAEKKKESGTAARQTDQRVLLAIKGLAVLTACNEKKDLLYQLDIKGAKIGDVVWDVVPLDGASRSDDLTAAINSVDKRGLALPASLPAGRYNLTVTNTIYDGSDPPPSWTATATVTKSATKVFPSAVPAFTDRIFWLGQDKVYVAVLPTQPSKCDGATYKPVVEWAVIAGTLKSGKTSFKGNQWNLNDEVEAGKTYKFQATTTLKAGGNAALVDGKDVQTVSIDVRASPPDARLVGGSTRLVGTGNDVKVALAKDQSGVTIAWACASRNSTDSDSFGGACPASMVGSGASFTIPKGTVPAGDYRISVTVSKGSDSASAQQTLRYQNGTLPLFALSCKLPDAGGASASAPLRCAATLESAPGGATFLWEALSADGTALLAPVETKKPELAFPAGAFATAAANLTSVTVKVTARPRTAGAFPPVSADLAITFATPPTCLSADGICCTAAWDGDLLPGVTPITVNCFSWAVASGVPRFSARQLKKSKDVNDIGVTSDPRNSFQLTGFMAASTFSFRLKNGFAGTDTVYVAVSDEADGFARQIIIQNGVPKLPSQSQQEAALNEDLNTCTSVNTTDGSTPDLDAAATACSSAGGQLPTDPTGSLLTNITAPATPLSDPDNSTSTNTTTAATTTATATPSPTPVATANATNSTGGGRRRHAAAWWGSSASAKRRRATRAISAAAALTAASSVLKGDTNILAAAGSSVTTSLLTTAASDYATSMQSVALSAANSALAASSDATGLLAQFATSLALVTQAADITTICSSAAFDQIALGTAFLAQGAPAYSASSSFNWETAVATPVKKIYDYYASNCLLSGQSASFPSDASLIGGVPSPAKVAVRRVTSASLLAGGEQSRITASASGTVVCPGSTFTFPVLTGTTAGTSVTTAAAGADVAIFHWHSCSKTAYPAPSATSKTLAAAVTQSPVAGIEVRTLAGTRIEIKDLPTTSAATQITVRFDNVGAAASSERLAVRFTETGGATYGETGISNVARAGTTLTASSTHLTDFLFIDLGALSSSTVVGSSSLIGAAHAALPSPLALLAALAAAFAAFL